MFFVGLFHRVIAQSGVANNVWAFSTSKQAREKTFKLGEALGCKTDCSKELVQFLRQVPSKELLEGVDSVLGEEVGTRQNSKLNLWLRLSATVLQIVDHTWF